jgi:hypothetical protein
MAHRTYTGKTIRLHDLFLTELELANHHFEDCVLRGPAIITSTGATFRLEHCSWDTGGGNVDSLVWEIDPARTGVVGALVFRDSSFVRCRFERVGLAGDPQTIAKFFGSASV